jgi:lysophospholipase L1-like esterase
MRRLLIIALLTLLCFAGVEGISYVILRQKMPALADIALTKHFFTRYLFDTSTLKWRIDPQGRISTGDPIPLHALYGWRFNAPAIFSHLKVDAQGFVLNSADSTSAIEPDADYRIIMIGGSTMAGSGVQDNADTIAAKLEQELERQTRLNINVVNAGTGGWYSVNELAFFTQEALPFHKPDMVIFMDGYNDMWRATTAAQQFTQRPDGTYTSSRSNYIFDATIQQNQAMLQSSQSSGAAGFDWQLFFTTTLILGLPAIKPPETTGFMNSFDGVNCPDVPFDLHPYLTNIRTAAGAAQANHVAILYVLQPVIAYKQHLTSNEQIGLSQMRYNVYQGKYADYGVPAGTCLDNLQRDYMDAVSEAYAALQHELHTDGVIIDDIARLFDDSTGEMFFDYAHYTASGNARIAQTLAQLVIPFIQSR